MFQQFMQGMIIGKAISDSLVREFYNNLNPQYRMAYIMRPFDETSSDKFIASQKDSIEYVYKLLQAGGDFAELAKKYSQETTSNKKGGDLGFVIRESLGDIKLREVMDELKQFTYSKPFRGYSGYYIFYKGETREVSIPPFEEAKGQIWETLFRTRRHDIKDKAKQKLKMLEPAYNYKINSATLNKIKQTAGGSINDSQYKTLRFDKLTETEMQMNAAIYDEGAIKVFELFTNPKLAPINMFEFNQDLASKSQTHLFALEAKKLGMQNIPKIAQELVKINDSVLRGIYFQKEVRDKAKAKTDSIKTLQKNNNEDLSKTDWRKKYFDIEREVKEKYENKLKEKYHYKYNEKYFDQALSEAEERKLIQNKEREQKK
jgi:hypothetical protein